MAVSGAAALLAACQPEQLPVPVAPAPQQPVAEPGLSIRHGRYIVMASQETWPAGLENAVGRANGKVRGTLNNLGMARVSSDDPDFARKAAALPGVELVVPEIVVQGFDPRQAGNAVESAGGASCLLYTSPSPRD